LATTGLLKLPVAVVERAYRARFQPARNAVKVKCVIAKAPRHSALFCSVGCLVCLAFNAYGEKVSKKGEKKKKKKKKKEIFLRCEIVAKGEHDNKKSKRKKSNRTQIHDVIATNGTIVNDNIPRPQSDGVPLLHFESLAVFSFATFAVVFVVFKVVVVVARIIIIVTHLSRKKVCVLLKTQAQVHMWGLM
jgi:hypothetical protein